MSFPITSFVAPWSLVGFSGPRVPSAQLAEACSSVFPVPVAVDCTNGIDQLVRSAFPQARVFKAASAHPGALTAWADPISPCFSMVAVISLQQC